MDERHYRRAAPWPLILIFLVLAIAICAAGEKYYQSRTRALRLEIQGDLATIATLKIDQISEWRRERLDDAVEIGLDAEGRRMSILELLSQPTPQGRASLLGWLEQLKQRHRFLDVAIVGPSGKVILSTGAQALESEETRVVRLASESSRPEISDFLLVEHGGRISIGLAVAIPLLPQEERGRSGTAILMRIDPQLRLYPLVQSWPTATRSAETLIVRREGEEVLYLNELRFRRDTALRLRLPLSTKGLPAAAAALGNQGPIEGQDYRGVPVLAVNRTIPETSWSMVAKIDSEEVYAPVREETRTIMAFVALLIGSAGVGLGYLWKVQTSHFFFQRYQEERDMREALLISERERDAVIAKLREALAQVKALSGILPICASCKKIRDDQGYWQQVESYIRDHSEAEFSHGICPVCAEKLYPGLLKSSTPKRGAVPDTTSTGTS